MERRCASTTRAGRGGRQRAAPVETARRCHRPANASSSYSIGSAVTRTCASTPACTCCRASWWRRPGGNIAADRGRLDFDIDMSQLDAGRIERRSTRADRARGRDRDRVDHRRGARRPARSRQDDEREATARCGRVRLLRIAGIDLQPCGGTYVRNIAEIGPSEVCASATRASATGASRSASPEAARRAMANLRRRAHNRGKRHTRESMIDRRRLLAAPRSRRWPPSCRAQPSPSRCSNRC